MASIFRVKVYESAMNKRAFLKLSSAMFATPFMSPLFAWVKGGKMSQDKMAVDRLKNWAGNLEYSTESLYSANSIEEARDFVKKQSHLKVLGTRHGFNNIADSKYNLLSLRSMDKVIALDTQARTVTVEAGISYGQLAPYLESKGFALHNLASLPHISIAGASSTATHGSGVKNGNLSTAVSALEIVTANGDVVTLSRQKDGETFRGAVVGWARWGRSQRSRSIFNPRLRCGNTCMKTSAESNEDHFEAINPAPTASVFLPTGETAPERGLD
jgi:xylitol oxidase